MLSFCNIMKTNPNDPKIQSGFISPVYQFDQQIAAEIKSEASLIRIGEKDIVNKNARFNKI